MGLFYFSRTSDPNPLAANYLIAGVMEADDLTSARAKLDEALLQGRRTDRSDSFAWSNLATTERAPSGLVAITLATTP